MERLGNINYFLCPDFFNIYSEMIRRKISKVNYLHLGAINIRNFPCSDDTDMFTGHLRLSDRSKDLSTLFDRSEL